MKIKSLLTIPFMLFLVIAFYYLSQNIVGELDINASNSKPICCRVEAVLADDNGLEMLDATESGYESSLFSGGQLIKAKVSEGKHQGEVIQIDNIKINSYTKSNLVEPGDEILVFIEEDIEGRLIGGILYEIVRTNYMYLIISLFLITLIVFGGMKGFKSIISLLITFIAIIKFMMPLMLKGHSPFTTSIYTCIFITLATFIISNGFSMKTLNAVLGTTGGVLTAGLIAYIISHLAKLTGLSMDEAQMLLLAPDSSKFNFQGLLFAGIIMGALGAVMDVSMSIASAINQVELAKPDISSRELIRAGMNVGRDVMGTMSNTLILAYVGGSIHLVLILIVYQYPLRSILSMDTITSEIVRAVSGSIGLIFTIPITAIISGSIGRRPNGAYIRR